jgi:hypothetical protein
MEMSCLFQTPALLQWGGIPNTHGIGGFMCNAYLKEEGLDFHQILFWQMLQ